MYEKIPQENSCAKIINNTANQFYYNPLWNTLLLAYMFIILYHYFIHDYY